MKKFIIVALVLVVATAFAFKALQAPTVGKASVAPVQSVSFQIAPPWLPTPDVGWNS